MAKVTTTTKPKKPIKGLVDEPAEAGKPVKASKPTKTKPAKPSIFARIGKYFGDVRAEMRRVVWPTRPEVGSASIVVIVTLIGFVIFTGVVDYISSFLFIDVLAKIGR